MTNLFRPPPFRRRKAEISPIGNENRTKGSNSIKKSLLILLLLFGTISFPLIFMAEGEFIIWRDGKPELAPWRKAKLTKELEDLNNAEQYALKASVPGMYPCYNCFGVNEIFLNLNDVWRYGVTTQGESGRYPDGLPHPGLYYAVEFEGPLQKCLEQEKIKIFNYALLPENLRRSRPLIRPPGNKLDR